MRERRGRGLAVAVLLAVLGACSADSEPTDTTGLPQVASSQPASATEGEAREAPTGAFFLDLRTGTQTPLPSTSGENVDYGAPFDDGHYYAVSPDGSRVYWENTCCSADDVAAVASSDGSQGRRLDPAGPVNYYAGGWSPDGTKIVYQERDGSGTGFGDWVVEDIASGRRTRIDLGLGSTEGLWYLAATFSGDGRNVIFQLPGDSSSGATWNLWSVPVTGGEPTLLVSNAAQPTTFGGPTYAFVRPIGDSFAGSRLVIATTDGLRTLVEATFEIESPKMSPDGSRIAYADGGSIHVVDVSTGESSEVAVARMAAWLDDDTLIVAPE